MSQTSSPDAPTIGTNALISQLKRLVSFPFCFYEYEISTVFLIYYFHSLSYSLRLFCSIYTISEAMMARLVEFMLDNNAPNSTSTLINGVTIIIDLIRHNNSDFEAEQVMAMNQGHAPIVAVNLGDMLRVLGNRVGEFQALLVTPKSVSGPVPTTMGPLIPLGFERLKVCELFAELLHCSNMSNLNVVVVEQVVAETPNNVNHVEETKLPEKVEEAATPASAEAEEKVEDVATTPSSVVPMETEPSTPPMAVTTSDTVVSSDEPKVLVNGTHNSGTGTVASVTATSAAASVPVGDFLKIKFVEHKVMPTCLRLLVSVYLFNDMQSGKEGTS
ncbi:SIT4 phosphatase-associated protein-domain-containing protein, partial [Jimgerdemannia flammicorona]